MARTARLEAAAGGGEPDFSRENAPWTFSGVAIGENDIVHTDSGERVIFTPEELAARGETQAGEPLTINHPTDEDGNPKYPPDVPEETVGRVPRAGHVGGKGLVYSAKTHDPQIAAGIYAGSYDVSVHNRFNKGERDHERNAIIAEDTVFLDLSVVSKGDAPSNTAEWGDTQELAAWTCTDEFREELAASATEAPADGDDDAGVTADNAPVNRGLLASVDRKLDALLGNDDTEGEGEAEDDEQADGEQANDEPADTGSDAGGNSGDQTMSEEDDPTIEEQISSALSDTIGDLGDADTLTEYVDESVSEAVASAREQAELGDKIDTIAAETDHDREDVEAWPTEAIEGHAAVASPGAAQVPGNVGAAGEAVGAVGGGDADDDLDEYDTGMAGE
jgi:hypothetical protein